MRKNKVTFFVLRQRIRVEVGKKYINVRYSRIQFEDNLKIIFGYYDSIQKFSSNQICCHLQNFPKASKKDIERISMYLTYLTSDTLCKATNWHKSSITWWWLCLKAAAPPTENSLLAFCNCCSQYIRFSAVPADTTNSPLLVLQQ